AVMGSSPLTRAATGSTAATGSRAKRMIRSPMVAFQKPIANQGTVAAKSRMRTRSSAPKPPADSALTPSQSRPIMLDPINPKNRTGGQEAGIAAGEILASLLGKRSSMEVFDGWLG